MKKYSTDKFILHPKEGVKMEGLVTPFLRFCIGISILMVALGVLGLMITPFIHAIKWW
ncbi:hypothetical protein [Moraxella sp. Pampa]|uniref:hypothetical protein n=1 Tax=Moraxella sp. Pampa TaxID=3111978 RepID=UPI002B410E2C|nr:hypothetical protein [Moraxella sp. Pampa]